MAHEHTSSEETAVAVAPERLPDDVDVARGLTADQVAARIASGQTNDVPDRASRSVKDIIRGNVFTRINAILTVLLVIVLATGFDHRRYVRTADHREQRYRHHPGDPRQAHARRSGDRESGQAHGQGVTASPWRWRPKMLCSTILSNSDPVTR